MNNSPREAVRTPFRRAVALVVAVAGVARAAEVPIPAIPSVPPAVAPAVQPKAARDEPKADGKGGDAKNGTGKNGKEAKPPAWQPWQPPGRPITLAECLAIANQRRPAIIAAQHSLAASERAYLSLLNLRRILERLSPDVPFRRQQAQRGIAAATAELRKAMLEGVYDTTRTYFEYVRATQQEQTATGVIDQLEIYYRIARDIVDGGGGNPRVKLNRFSLGTLEAVIDEVRDLREKASFGRKLAVEALREALGFDAGDELVYPAATKLPVMGGTVTREEVVARAMATRTELVQAAVLVDVSRLEVCAQGALSHRYTVQTFAAGSDLHSRVFPVPIRNGDYRPGAVAPEMPTLLVGRRDDRVARATIYSQKMDEVYREAEHLVRLEAEKAYLDWKATAERLEQSEKRYERGRKLAEDARAAAAASEDPQLLVQNEGLAGKAQAAYVEAVYEHLKAMLTLERVTGGQVRAGFGDR